MLLQAMELPTQQTTQTPRSREGQRLDKRSPSTQPGVHPASASSMATSGQSTPSPQQGSQLQNRFPVGGKAGVDDALSRSAGAAQGMFLQAEAKVRRTVSAEQASAATPLPRQPVTPQTRVASPSAPIPASSPLPGRVPVCAAGPVLPLEFHLIVLGVMEWMENVRPALGSEFGMAALLLSAFLSASAVSLLCVGFVMLGMVAR